MNMRDKKGSITMFVVFGLLFMTSFLIISFGSNINKSKSAKDQFNLLSGIYSHGDSDEEAYDRAYADLRNKNKKTLTASVSSSSVIELVNTFNEKLIDYKIYGNTASVGKYISTGKYQIQINVTDKNSNSETYIIYLASPLKKSGTLVDYIDFKNQRVVRRVGSQTVENISLPKIYAYDDYTKIEIVNTNKPSKIEVEYVGYEFIS